MLSLCVCVERERESCVCVERERGVSRPFLLLSLPDAAYVVIVLLQKEREGGREREREREEREERERERNSLRPHTLLA